MQVKVLLQTQTKGEFQGVVHCIKDVVANNGFLGLYRGLLTPLVGSMAENAVLFTSYGMAQRTITGLRGETGEPGREIVCARAVVAAGAVSPPCRRACHLALLTQILHRAASRHRHA